MITKDELIHIWVKYVDEKHAPEKYKALFSANEFMSLVQGSFMTEDERNSYCDMLTKKRSCVSVYCSNMLTVDYRSAKWTDTLWNNILLYFIDQRLKEVHSDYYDKIIDGILCILEKPIKEYSLGELPVEFKKFYNNTEYGWFNLPHLINIVYTLNLHNIYYDKINSYTGFNNEEDVKKFDLNNWTKYFKKSKRITTLKDSVSKDGIVLDIDKLPKYEYGSLNHFDIAKEYYPYAEKIAIIHKVLGKYVKLRKVNIGSCYIEELIPEYGWLCGFYNETPIYKISTIQGFSFYICKSNWAGGVYIDDITIKSIIFDSVKPNNLSIDKDKRIFIVYNTQTGYWQLPELYYPVKYKMFVKDILEKQKDTIGCWRDTTVFAHSRTLNGDNYLRNIDEYPDVRTRSEFICKMSETLERYANNIMQRNDNFRQLSLNIKVEYNIKDFDYDSIVKPLNCINQNDIYSYLNNDNECLYRIEKYTK